MRIWDRANALAQNRDEEFTLDFIKEIVDTIGNIEEFVKQPSDFKYHSL